MRVRIAQVVSCFAIAVAGCRETVRPLPLGDVAKIDVASPASDTLAPGARLPLQFRALDATGRVVTDRAPRWLTSDSTVATIDANGVITARAVGGALITGLLDSARASIRVTVLRRPAKLMIQPATVQVGQTVAIRGTLLDSSGIALPDTFSLGSGDLRIASFELGGLTGQHVGTGQITTKFAGVTFSAPVTVTPPQITSLVPGFRRVLVQRGSQRLLDLRVMVGFNVVDWPAQWTSSNPSIATVDSTGVVTGVSEGETVVTAQSDTAKTTVTVRVFSYGELPLYADVSAETMNCGLTTSHHVYCWGSVGSGSMAAGPELDQNSAAISAEPLPVNNGIEFGSLVGAALSSGCGISITGMLYCWGGSGIPATVVRPDVVFRTAAKSQGGLCGIDLQGNAYCFAANFNQPLRIDFGGTLESHRIASPVAFEQTAMNPETTCALSGDGALYCWGVLRKAGTSAGPRTDTPRQVGGSLRFRSLAMAADISFGPICAIGVNRRTYCFPGALDADSSADRFIVDDGHTFEKLSLGGSGAGILCAVDDRADGYCWAYEPVGNFNVTGIPQLGTGRPPTSPVDRPGKVIGGLKFRSIGVGATGTCGATLDGLLYCWGDNTSGRLALPLLPGNRSSDYVVPQRALGQP